jgi:hypothetical protein
MKRAEKSAHNTESNQSVSDSRLIVSREGNAEIYGSGVLRVREREAKIFIKA